MTTFVDRHRSDFDFISEISNGFPTDADILWRDHAGDDVLWLMNNNALSTAVALPTVTPDWHAKATANFDNNFLDADILGRTTTAHSYSGR